MTNYLASKFEGAASFQEVAAILDKEMQKAHQSVESTRDIVLVDRIEEIQTRLITEAPFLRFLEEKGRVQNTNSAIFSWNTKDSKKKAKFTPDCGTLPNCEVKDWGTVEERMRAITFCINVCDMAQMGNQNVNLIEDDRVEGYADIAARKDQAMLIGDSDEDANCWDGIAKLAETNEDMDGEPITMDAIDEVVDEVISLGGRPDAIVTTAKVARQLTKEQQEKNYFVDKTQFCPGGWTRCYYTPNGDIPLITDANLVGYDNGDILEVIDSSAVINKTLMPVSEVALCKTKLATDSVLATFTGFGVMAPQKLGVLENIGTSP